jgi:hypothetical protein
MSSRRQEIESWTKIESLMKQFEWAAAEALLLCELSKAERRGNQALEAQCYSNLGNVAEAQGRLGDAFRHWSRAIFLLGRLGLIETAEGERLRSLLRLWHENPRVWVSYCREDTKRVEPILSFLRRKKIEVMYDREFWAGHSIQRQILAAILRCSKFIVFWSKNSHKSEWVHYEIEVLDRQRSRDLSRQAWDNVIIFYCLDPILPPNSFSDDVQIVESELGPANAAAKLVQSIASSEILARFDRNADRTKG